MSASKAVSTSPASAAISAGSMKRATAGSAQCVSVEKGTQHPDRVRQILWTLLEATDIDNRRQGLR